MGQIALLLIIYSTFCEAFSSEGDGKERLDFHRAFVVIFIGKTFISTTTTKSFPILAFFSYLVPNLCHERALQRLKPPPLPQEASSAAGRGMPRLLRGAQGSKTVFLNVTYSKLKNKKSHSYLK